MVDRKPLLGLGGGGQAAAGAVWSGTHPQMHQQEVVLKGSENVQEGKTGQAVKRHCLSGALRSLHTNCDHNSKVLCGLD